MVRVPLAVVPGVLLTEWVGDLEVPEGVHEGVPEGGCIGEEVAVRDFVEVERVKMVKGTEKDAKEVVGELEVEKVWEGHVTPNCDNCPEVYTVEDTANNTNTSKEEQEEAMGRPLAAHTPLTH